MSAEGPRVEPTISERHHRDFQDLLGAYALGAVDFDERAALDAHLATCPTCPVEVAALRAAVGALPLTVVEREPSPELRDRIEVAIRRDLAGDRRRVGDGAVAPFPTGAAGVPVRREPAGSIRRLRANPWAIAAVLLLACSLGLLLWNLNLRQDARPDAVESVALQTTDAAPGASGDLTYLPDRRVAILTVRDLPPLPPEQVYQVWLIGDAAPVPSGVFAERTAEVAVAVDAERYQALALTIEPGPLGSPGPTTVPFAQAPLPPV